MSDNGRSSSARRRREGRNPNDGTKYPMSRFGRVEGVKYSVRMAHSMTAADIGSFDCWDYSLASSCISYASSALLVAPNRCAVVLEGTLLNATNQKDHMARTCKFNRNPVAQVTILPPRCPKCGQFLCCSNSPPSWTKPCDCSVSVSYILHEHGWRSLRNWARLCVQLADSDITTRVHLIRFTKCVKR